MKKQFQSSTTSPVWKKYLYNLIHKPPPPFMMKN
jgi:hypothetical protein